VELCHGRCYYRRVENDGSGGGCSSASDSLASLNTAVGVESVCSSFIRFPPSRSDKGIVRC
jgi:hypothetical protein